MLLVPTTSGGWKALAVVAQSAAAAAALVGDLTILRVAEFFCEFCSLRVLYCGEIARAVWYFALACLV